MVNTIPENTPFYPTDHTGVIRINNKNIHYRYLAYKLEQAGIKEGFSRSYRASIGQIKKLSFMFPDINKQNEAVNEVEILEKLIEQEFSIMKFIGTKKEDVIKNYLR